MKSQRILLAGLSAFLIWGLTACSSSGKQKTSSYETGMTNKGGMRMMGEGRMMTPEMHEEMAEKHKGVAACLKSGKTQQECMPMMKMEGMGMGMMGQSKMGMMNESMMKNMDQCMNQIAGRTMNNKGMEMMRQCMKQMATQKGSEGMGGEKHEIHHQ